MKISLIWGPLCLAAAFGIVGCASQAEDDSYVGWQCSGGKRSDNWTCEQQEVKDGKPVSPAVESEKVDVVISTEVNDIELEPMPKPKQAKLIYVGIPRQQWRESLPTLTAEPVISDGEEQDTLRRPRRLPERQPDPVSLSATAPVKQAPMTGEQKEPLSSEANPQQAAVTESNRGFTLQLGAFRTQVQLQAFILDHQLKALPSRQFETHRNDEVWHVITWGQFNTPAEAEQAWAKEALNYPNVQPWVRPLNTLKDAVLALDS